MCSISGIVSTLGRVMHAWCGADKSVGAGGHDVGRQAERQEAVEPDRLNRTHDTSRHAGDRHRRARTDTHVDS